MRAGGDCVLFLSHTHGNGVFKVGSHHLARNFARFGYRVVHVSSPYSLLHKFLDGSEAAKARSDASGRDVVDDDGVVNVVPRLVLPARFSSLGYLRAILDRHCVDRARFVFLDQPLMARRGVSQFGGVNIYRPTDLYVTGASARMQRQFLMECDGVVATSVKVLEELGAAPGKPHMVLRNGVDWALFNRAESGHRQPPRSGVIYVGALDARFDWRALDVMARHRPDLDFNVWGPEPEPPCPLSDNVSLLGSLPYERLADKLNASRVGILPLSAEPVNSGRSPMKLFEYLASGLRVVARQTDTLVEDDQIGVYTYADLAHACAALDRAVGVVGENHEGRLAARGEDWEQKARELENFALTVERERGEA